MNSAAAELKILARCVAPALLSPTSRTFELRPTLIGKQIEPLIADGARLFLSGGSIGEAGALSLRERIDLFDATLDAVDAMGVRESVILNLTSGRLAEVTALAEAAAAAGAGAMVAMPPTYELTIEEQRAFLSWIDGTLKTPFILYASRDAMTDPPDSELLEECLNLEWFTGLKDATGDLDRLEALTHHFGDDLLIINAAERILVEASGLGIPAAMTATASFAPSKVAAVIDASLDRDHEAALSAFSPIGSFRALFDPGPRGHSPRYLPWTKAAADLLGFEVGPPRPPLMPLTTKETDRLRAVLHRDFRPSANPSPSASKPECAPAPPGGTAFPQAQRS